MTNDSHVTTQCVCSDPNHQMTFNLRAPWRLVGERQTFIEEAELFISVQLNQRYGFWRRGWLALQYVWGKRSRFGGGHWDEGSFSVEDARDLQSLLDNFIAMSVHPEEFVEK